MVTESCNFSVTISIELDSLVKRHSWDSGRVDTMLIFFKKLVRECDGGIIGTEDLGAQIIHHAL